MSILSSLLSTLIAFRVGIDINILARSVVVLTWTERLEVAVIKGRKVLFEKVVNFLIRFHHRDSCDAIHGRTIAARARFTKLAHLGFLLPCKPLVLHPARPHRIFPQPPDLVGLVVLEVALEPFDVGIPFEGQDMRAEAVEEEAVVGDDDGAAGEVLQRVLEGAEGFHVEIVGGLVQQ